MPVYERELWLPHGCEPLFDLIADIERYPAFVPGYREARITHRQGHTLQVFQSVGLGPMRLGFHSVAELARPERLTVHSVDNPFADLRFDWRLSGDGRSCRLRFRAEYRLRGGLPTPLISRWLDQQNARVLDAFVARAAALLTPATGAPEGLAETAPELPRR